MTHRSLADRRAIDESIADQSLTHGAGGKRRRMTLAEQVAEARVWAQEHRHLLVESERTGESIAIRLTATGDITRAALAAEAHPTHASRMVDVASGWSVSRVDYAQSIARALGVDVLTLALRAATDPAGVLAELGEETLDRITAQRDRLVPPWRDVAPGTDAWQAVTPAGAVTTGAYRVSGEGEEGGRRRRSLGDKLAAAGYPVLQGAGQDIHSEPIVQTHTLSADGTRWLELPAHRQIVVRPSRVIATASPARWVVAPTDAARAVGQAAERQSKTDRDRRSRDRQAVERLAAAAGAWESLTAAQRSAQTRSWSKANAGRRSLVTERLGLPLALIRADWDAVVKATRQRPSERRTVDAGLVASGAAGATAPIDS